MRIVIERFENNHVLVAPRGRIDADNSPEFQEAIEEACMGAEHVELDFKGCEYISSSGLRVLLKLRKLIPERDKLLIRNVNDVVYEVFDMTGFTDMIEIERDSDRREDIKAIFLDVDGTLLSHSTGMVPESAKEAIEKVRKNGIKVVLATGRAWNELSRLPVMELKFDAYLTLNGNICLDSDAKMITGNEIDPGEVEILVNIFEASRIPFVLIGEKQRYINYVDDVVINTQASTHGTVPDIGEYRGEKIYQCIAFADVNTRLKLDEMLDQCLISSWNENGIDIIAKTGGKDAGIQKYLDEMGFVRTQSMAFGDGENDIAMIKYAGIGVAMGNGTEELKNAADYVTTSIDDDGIKNALIHFGLIEDE